MADSRPENQDVHRLASARSDSASASAPTITTLIGNSTYEFIGLLRPDGTLLDANQAALDFLWARRSPKCRDSPLPKHRGGRVMPRAARGAVSLWLSRVTASDGVEAVSPANSVSTTFWRNPTTPRPC